MLISGTQLLADGGKTGDLYILNGDKLGKFNANDSQVVQKQQVPAGAPLLYVWGPHDVLKS